jgi:glycosyltransferase 2 family protein
VSGKGKLIGFVVTLVFLGLAFYRVDLRGVGEALARANYAYVLPALLCWLVGYVVRTARWRTILAEASTCSFPTLFGVLMIGFATNNLVPARLGEVARAYLLRRHTGIRKTYLLASVFLERLFDGLILVALLAGLSLMVDVGEPGRRVELLAGAIFLAVAVGVGVLLARRDLAERLLQLALRPFPDRLARWTSGAFGAFMLGLGTMRRRAVLARTALYSGLVWGLEWGSYFILSAGFDFGLSTAERAAACALLLAFVNLGIMLPAAPGYVGTFQFFAMSALAIFGVGGETALAFAIVAHAAQYALVTLIGLGFLGREGVSLAALTAARSEDGGADPDTVAATHAPDAVASEATR